MGKDFRIGLMVGVVLAGAALIWVATRPSLSPQAVQTQNLASVQQSARPAIDNQPTTPARLFSDETVEAGATETGRGPAIAQMPEPPAQNDPNGRPHVGEPRGNLPDLTVYESSEPIKTTKFHIVRKGETLSGIAQQYYGSSDRWRKILTGNAKTIKDPNKIAPGTKLIIPE